MTKKKHHKKTKHPNHKKHKTHPSKNFRAMWVIGLIIFILGILLDNAWIIIPGGILALYGIMNRHSWHLKHIK